MRKRGYKKQKTQDAEINKKETKTESKKRLKLLFFGSASFFAIAVLTISIMFYSVYFFRDVALKIIFRLIIALIGSTIYYILINEFIDYYNKKNINSRKF